jgi:hypothetical protein
MPNRWLQIKGDPSVRGFLFQQQREESLFDGPIDRIHEIAHTLLMNKGVFHIKIHYSSNQLTCWFMRDPYCYVKFLREEVLEDGFLNRFMDAGNTGNEGRSPVLGSQEIELIFKEFRRLRLTDQTIYLRNGSVNLIDGMINMGFSCDGTHYIDYKNFLAKLDKFETTN